MNYDYFFRTAAIKHIGLLFTVLFLCLGINYAQLATNFPAIIPLPAAVKQTEGIFHINSSTKIVCKSELLFKTTQLLNLYLEVNSIKQLPVSINAIPTNFILIEIDSAENKNSEGYTLNVESSFIQITAHDAAGIIYAIQTLRQLWKKEKNNSLSVPGCIITDYPRFSYRGMSLDVGRHLFPVSFIKKYIDLLALYKFNSFHWHLTEDQGWRIEIKKYPKLQSIAAWRDETLIGHKKELPHRFDGKKYGGYYTQSAIKDIVQYASQRNITIIPEIEMPGHALAALSAYPSLGCTRGPYKAATFWGIFDDVYCAGNDSTFIFLQDVLDEVMELFPSKYIHIGGDECPKTRWKVCPRCQERIRTLDLKDEHGLQSYLIRQMEKYINSKGRDIIGWDEILEGGLAPNATVMSWRGEEGGIAAAEQSHYVIMTPESHFYFDYYQSLYPEEPLAAGGYTALSKVYSYKPAGDKINTTVSLYIKGIEGQAWSEYMGSTAKAEYMIFPRAMALAELAWTPSQLRNYPDFLVRLRTQKKLLDQLKVNEAGNFDEINFSSSTVTSKGIEVSLQSSLPGSSIYYSTNGISPSLKDEVYKDAISITKSCILKAQLYNNNRQKSGRVFQQKFTVHKAVGKPVTLINKPIGRFNTDPEALVNGIGGTDRYNNGQWVGFSGDNLEGVIDLRTEEKISSVSMNFLNYHWQRMWAPVMVEVFISTDSVKFTKIYTTRNFPVNGINSLRAVVTPVKARYIKVTGLNKGIIPDGEYGSGNKALLMIDEILIN